MMVSNFEGLLQVAEELDEDTKLSALADYCRQREQGLRRKALATLDTFLNSAEAWETPYARRACQRILEIEARSPEVHQFVAQPLLSRFILPVLEDWVASEPANQRALRWLGMTSRDSRLLERALELAPSDVPVRRYLVGWLLSDVDHATHHLVESRLAGELDATKRTLAEARDFVAAAPDLAGFEDLMEEIREYEPLLEDWEAYSASPEGTFPEWCSRRGRQYGWPSFFYYRK